ncbi:murein hydrolase activator EnvC family protein [Desulfovibrio litoralis]|uniref:murein hydrolase activator EnvC family protein n=1 Tax=Desulfovibrio litoralis TaxID=466107 RepID=UPI0015BBE6FF|nr:peptidoglycan DD-metalloendopeptidase family protein [Desulfovibrio litoralis]
MTITACDIKETLAAPSGANLKKALQAEEKKAKERREKISRLIGEEKNISQDLAATEKEMFALNKNLEEAEKKLATLSVAEDDVKKDYQRLLNEQKKIERAMQETLRLLWDLASKEEAVGFKDLPDWHVSEREYSWSKELFSLLNTQKQELVAKAQEIAETLGKRESLAAEAKKQLRLVNIDKNKLLKSQIKFKNKIAELRKEKKTTEAELDDVLDLIKDLNIKIENVAEQGSLENLKDKLNWPVQGKLVKAFNPNASPPVRGVGLSTKDKAEVSAIAYGKVVHEDLLRGFGRVVILMHNGAYYTLYAYLSESKVNVGDEVKRGQTIGRTGYYPDINGPGLYFELRSHQKTINPAQWCK